MQRGRICEKDSQVRLKRSPDVMYPVLAFALPKKWLAFFLYLFSISLLVFMISGCLKRFIVLQCLGLKQVYLVYLIIFKSAFCDVLLQYAARVGKDEKRECEGGDVKQPTWLIR